MASAHSILKQINNTSSANSLSSAAGFSSSISEVILMPNQSVGSHTGGNPAGDPGGGFPDSQNVIVEGLRDWGYMSLENVRPVFTDEHILLNPYTVPLYGAVLPLFAILTLVTNCLTCIVLTQQGMRSATGCLLIAIALSDMSMAVWPLPPFFYFYTLGNHREWVPHAWCYASLWMLEFLPTIFHATSIWLMVALAGQRYLAVCRPLQTQRWCVSNSPGAVQCSIVIFILAMGTQLSRIFESNFSAKKLPSRLYPGTYVMGCNSQFAPFVSAFTDIYFKVYFCFKTLAIHVIPCLMIVYLSLSICITKIKKKCCRKKMAQTTISYRSRIKDYWIRMHEVKYSTSLVMFLILLFLIVETPLAVFYAIELIQDKIVFEFNIVPTDTLTSMILFANMSTIVVSPLKFLVYAGCCKRFREHLKDMYRCCKSFFKCNDDEEDDEDV